MGIEGGTDGDSSTTGVGTLGVGSLGVGCLGVGSLGVGCLGGVTGFSSSLGADDLGNFLPVGLLGGGTEKGGGLLLLGSPGGVGSTSSPGGGVGILGGSSFSEKLISGDSSSGTGTDGVGDGVFIGSY